jgi:large subunit ribosomal protein L6e
MGKGKPRAQSRNAVLVRGINVRGRTANARKAHRFEKNIKKAAAAPKEEQKQDSQKEPRFYAADDERKPIPSRKHRAKQTRLRPNLRPGSVVIILAGRFKGKRVVFLKQLPSGLLLVTGPYKVNGVPLRRVNQAYVIITSTVLDVSKAEVAAIDDAFFARASAPVPKKDGDEFFAKEKAPLVVSEAKKATQKIVDDALLPQLSRKNPAQSLLRSYLNAKFSLTAHDLPHLMKF